MEKPALKLVVPGTVNGTTEKLRRTMPNRRANDKIRPRMHLTETEIARLKATAIKVNQHGFRDAVMISLAFRSCLRIGELVTLTWDCISFEEGTVHMAAGFRKMLARLGVEAGIGFPICPHQLRHGGLTKLAGDNVDAITLAAYSGHRQLQNLQRYIRLSPEKFNSFRWKD